MQTAVIIGRFSPVHRSHIEQLISKGLEYDRVLILIGSCQGPRTFKNPWTGPERVMMIVQALEDLKYKVKPGQLHFEYLVDYPDDNDAWVKQVEMIATRHCKHPSEFLQIKPNVGLASQPTLIGNYKDQSSFYLKLFPEWESKVYKPIECFSATTIRQAMLDNTLDDYTAYLAPSTLKFIKNWMTQHPDLIQKWKTQRVTLETKSPD
jgi:bifunctional NMN adenylyltransferase/nudix hydrolase